MWIATSDLPTSPGHPFYQRLNELLDEAKFDGFVEGQCRKFYATGVGRPSLPPGRYFRMLLLGYFEGIDSERGIAWRAADSLGIRNFLGLSLDEAGPDHSTISRNRRLIDVETHRAVFTWVQERLACEGLLKGRTVAIDATTLEANAAMRSIVRRDTGESYDEFLRGLAEASGIKTPSREALVRLDRRRKKKTSNEDWMSPADPDARVAKMKDKRTHLAHKAETAVDTETGAIVAITIQGADQGDTTTIKKTLAEAMKQVETLMVSPSASAYVSDEGLLEVVADKGYHSDETLLALEHLGLRSYISEPARGRRKWKDEQLEAQPAVYANRRRMRGARGARLGRQRGERAERPFAHLYETANGRRTHLRGHDNILKRMFIHASGLNLGLVIRDRTGVGTPRGFQGVARALLVVLWTLCSRLQTVHRSLSRRIAGAVDLGRSFLCRRPRSASDAFTTGC